MSNRTVGGFYIIPAAVRPYFHPVRLMVFHQASRQMLRLRHNTGHKGTVKLFHGPVLQHSSHLLETMNGFPGNQQAGCIPVQTVADGRPEGSEIIFCDLSAVHKIVDDEIIG